MKLICFPFFKLIILDKAILRELQTHIRYGWSVRQIRYGCIWWGRLVFFIGVWNVQGLQVIERGVTTDRTRSYTFLVVRPCTKSCPLPLVWPNAQGKVRPWRWMVTWKYFKAAWIYRTLVRNLISCSRIGRGGHADIDCGWSPRYSLPCFRPRFHPPAQIIRTLHL